MAATVEMPPGRVARKALCTFLGLAFLVGCLTVLFLGMRAVMDIGGSCGSGDVYVVATPCPKGVGWMVPVSIWVGVFSLGFYIGNRSGLPGPDWTALAWPALFLSLGWNFWEYGLDPPGTMDGLAVGPIICGVIFVLMGAVPLFATLASPAARRGLVWGDAEPSSGRPGVREVARAVKPTFTSGRTPADRPSGPGGAIVAPAPTTAPAATAVDVADPPDADPTDAGSARVDGPDGDLAEDLERLAGLFRDGHLTVDEYADAKRRRLGRAES